MQTAAELITEVQEQTGSVEGADFWTEAYLEVWFETTRSVVPIYGSDPNALEELNSLVELGGRPIGVIHVQTSPEGVEVWSRPTADYKEQRWVAHVLNPLVEKLADAILADYRDNPA